MPLLYKITAFSINLFLVRLNPTALTISIYCYCYDKDVLSKRVVQTDWDQGSMQLIEFKILLAYLFKNSHAIGVDICGECANEVGLLNEIKEDDVFNKKIFSFLKEEEN